MDNKHADDAAIPPLQDIVLDIRWGGQVPSVSPDIRQAVRDYAAKLGVPGEMVDCSWALEIDDDFALGLCPIDIHSMLLTVMGPWFDAGDHDTLAEIAEANFDVFRMSGGTMGLDEEGRLTFFRRIPNELVAAGMLELCCASAIGFLDEWGENCAERRRAGLRFG